MDHGIRMGLKNCMIHKHREIIFKNSSLEQQGHVHDTETSLYCVDSFPLNQLTPFG